MVGDHSGGRDRYDRSRERDYHNKGIDPDTYGQDMADRKDIYEDKDLMVAAMHVWIRHADQWDRPDKHPFRADRYNKNRYQKDSKKKKYSKDDDYKGKDKDYKKKDDNYNDKDSDSDEGYKGKDKYKKVTFPVRVYKSYKKFPQSKSLPLILVRK